MRILRAFIYFALTTVLGTDALAQGTPTLWDHNGSQVALYVNGTGRKFYYTTPVPALLQYGVQSGTPLFDGRRNGSQYSGTAYVFSKQCGPLAYAVSGPVSQDDRTVTLYGKAPVVDASCRVVGYRDDVDVLVFNLLPDTQTGANQSAPVQPYDREYDTFLNTWSACFEVVDSIQSVNFGLMTCETALSFSRLDTHDRALLLNRQAYLTQQKTAFEPQQSQVPKSHQAPPIPETPLVDLVRENSFQPAAKDIGTSIDPDILILVVGYGTVVLILIIAYFMQRRPLNASSPGAAAEETANKAPANSDNLPATLTDADAASGGSPQISNQPPSRSMSLKLKRSQRASAMGKMIFGLDAHMGLTTEEHTLIRKYRLGGHIVYDSKNREKYRETTKAHLESTRDQPSLFIDAKTQFLGAGKTLYRLGRASVSATMAALSLRITIDSLIRGVHVECKSMEELLEAEDAIVQAGRNLKAYLETAATFDGREQLIEL